MPAAIAGGGFGEHPFHPFPQHTAGDLVERQVSEAGEDVAFGFGEVGGALGGVVMTVVAGLEVFLGIPAAADAPFDRSGLRAVLGRAFDW
ncbi:hypothetical protein [Nonomuraea sp. NPDC050643]|uniref:hypothetical protein n=1 Tax=Nonomuraea sp. NPDC050643 TaxID=3155660 RepID=UPI003403B771